MAKKFCFVLYVDKDEGRLSMVKFANVEEAGKEIIKQYKIDGRVPSSIIVGEPFDVDVHLDVVLKEKG